MLRYRLRSLLIVLALGPPVLAGVVVFLVGSYQIWREKQPRVYYEPDAKLGLRGIYERSQVKQLP